MKQSDAEILCSKWLPLWTGNQPAALASIYSDDLFYRDPVVPGGLRGKAEFLDYLKRMLAANPNWLWSAEEILEAPKGFTLKWRAEIPVGTQIVKEYGLDIVEVNAQGKICRNEVYFDRTALLKALKKT